jgi:sialic acid synthase SpsE
MAVQIIAEVGECFNGSMEQARRMIKEAAQAGCNVVKFQILDMEEVSADDPEYDWFSKIELDRENIKLLKKWAEEEHIDILFTPVSLKTAAFLVEENVDTVKIASSFIRKKELLEYINDHFRKVYVSTGMADLEEIRKTVQILKNPEEVIILHCISEYPTGPLLERRGLKALEEQDAHLNMINILRREFPEYKIGYSDHTDGVFAPIIAAAMGAEVIEKHFTLDRKTPIYNYEQKLEYMGTDHVLSVEPDDLRKMVELIRRAESCQGDMEWRRSEGEIILREFLRGRYTER